MTAIQLGDTNHPITIDLSANTKIPVKIILFLNAVAQTKYANHNQIMPQTNQN